MSAAANHLVSYLPEKCGDHHTTSYLQVLMLYNCPHQEKKIHQFTPMPILDAKGIHRLRFSCFAHRVERRKSYPSSTAHQRPSQLFCHRPLSLHPILQIVTVIKQQILSNYQSVSNAMWRLVKMSCPTLVQKSDLGAGPLLKVFFLLSSFRNKRNYKKSSIFQLKPYFLHNVASAVHFQLVSEEMDHSC